MRMLHRERERGMLWKEKLRMTSEGRRGCRRMKRSDKGEILGREARAERLREGRKKRRQE